MNELLWGTAGLGSLQLLQLFGHFLLLSLLAVGGAMTTAPDMHRYVVAQQGWISDAQFSQGVALAQAAPGPNVLYVAVIGLQVAGLAGVVAALAGTLLPSSTLALCASRYGERRRDARALRAFTAGMAPLTVGLLASTGWVLLEPARGHAGAAALLVLATVVLMLRTRLGPLWLLGGGALAGAAGWV